MGAKPINISDVLSRSYDLLVGKDDVVSSDCDSGYFTNGRLERVKHSFLDDAISAQEKWNCLFRHEPEKTLRKMGYDFSIPKSLQNKLLQIKGKHEAITYELIKELYSYLIAFPERKGFGVKNNISWKAKSKSKGIQMPAQVAKTKEASCVEVVLFLKSCFDYLGIDSYAVDVNIASDGRDMFGKHTAIEVELGDGKRILLDPVQKADFNETNIRRYVNKEIPDAGFDIKHKLTLRKSLRQILSDIEVANSRVFYEKKSLEAAMLHLQKAKVLAPDSPKVLLASMFLHKYLNKWSDALGDARMYCEIEQDDYEYGWMNYALYLQKTGNVNESVKAYIRAAALIIKDDKQFNSLKKRKRLLSKIAWQLQMFGKTGEAKLVRMNIDNLK